MFRYTSLKYGLIQPALMRLLNCSTRELERVNTLRRCVQPNPMDFTIRKL